jgi:hypothetical protein
VREWIGPARFVKGDQVNRDLWMLCGIFSDDGNGIADTIVLQADTFDLAQLDAKAAQFDLLIGTSDELDLACFIPPGQIAGSI